MLRGKIYLILSLFAFSAFQTPLYSQVQLGEGISLSGHTKLQYQFYNSNAFNGGFNNIRQPMHLPQINARLELNIKNTVRVPLEVFITPVIQVPGFGVNTPAEGAKSLNPLQFLMHPAQRLYARPSLYGFTFHLGHFVQPYSGLSTGDIKVFGLGADYQFKSIKLSAQRGIIQPRVPNNIFNFSNGSFRRTLSAVRVEGTAPNKWRHGFSFAFVDDHVNSLEVLPMANNPEKSAVASWFARYNQSKQTQYQFEIANSSWAPNVSATDTLNEFGGVGSFLLGNTNVLGGLGISAKMFHNPENYRIDSRLSWNSTNYRSLAYPFMLADILDVEVNPQFTAFDKRLNTNLVLSYKGNNFSGTYGSRLNIPILKLNSSMRITEQAFVNLVYALNTVSGAISDSSKIKSSNQVVRLLPSYQFEIDGIKQTVSLIIGWSQYSNQSTFLFAPTKVSTQNFGAVYRANYLKHSASLSLTTFNTSSGGNSLLRNNTLTLSGRTKAVSDQLIPFFRYTYTSVRGPDFANPGSTIKLGGKQVIQLGARYRVNGRTAAHLSFSLLNNRQGTGSGAPGYREMLLRSGISYQL